jgi:hypothetical protein
MAFYDIFNGDADGICALTQLRLAEPRQAFLVTGTKREIRLVERVNAQPTDELTVLDISFDVNRQGVIRAVNAGARVRYFDHHFAGALPVLDSLEAHVDTSATTCTSLIVDRFLGGKFRPWAVVAAFGDNLVRSAREAAAPLGFAPHALEQLRELGECINYNAYGESVDDLHYTPEDLYRALSAYPDPFEFIAGEPILEVLRNGKADDIYRAQEVTPVTCDDAHAIIVLPDAAWSRRVSGILANQLSNAHPSRAHAVLIAKAGGFLVSVRAPLSRPSGADTLCRQFDSGGGRAGAAGINHLPQAEFDRFAAALRAAFTPRSV